MSLRAYGIGPMTNKKQYEFIINTQQDLIRKLFVQNDWTLEANKKVMKTETDNWYLEWKVSYLEKWIKKHVPDAALYAEDDETFNEIKKGSKSDKDNGET